ncbi:WEB family protein At5g16730, chloroplastic-like isoform X1 [Nymphaea colorata]|uniref:WEB family protein At5g16730, chloroplastic-like isoform X1 n=1 Tax=Nymphaea colorata TaxID=210225 RepID=UPI00129D7F62|nr:WEB family protein At5g16730, chloroplastic-like isoform X1 [Nymphaea colorata]XP_031502500.1 WEB family protein At5g16730, chloroplastic-like isoform X1 [Nymphaea colorata]
MISSRTRTGLFEAPHKTSPATPRANKLSRAGSKSEHESSPSPLQPGRLSVDRSPRSVDSRPRSVDSRPGERRSPKIATPEKRVVKGPELQSQLGLLQEDLKKTKELLEKTEAEKSKAIEDLKEAKRAAEEANEKLSEALVLQKRAEENSEIEKFRADELEQASIDAAQNIEQKWQSEIELVKKQHLDEVSALLSANEEVDRIKQELAMVAEAKNAALVHADSAMKIAEENAKKVEDLNRELVQVRETLDTTRASQLAVNEEKAMIDAMWESKAKEASELVERLGFEIESLKQELARARVAEEKLVETEGMIEKLKVELNDAKNSESDAVDSAAAWKKKVELLEVEVTKAKSSEKTANESVVSLLKQLEESNKFLQEAEAQIVSLTESIESLEMSLGKQQGDLKKSDQQIEAAKAEADSMANTIETLKKEIERLKEDKAQANENEEMIALKIQSLMEEKSKLSDELRVAREEEEKSKNAMDDLALALREVSMETNKVKESLATTEDQLAEARSQIEDLKMVLQVTEEKYQVLVGEARKEVDHYKDIALKNDLELQSSRADWEEKELKFLSCMKKSEEEIMLLKEESDKLAGSFKAAVSEAQMAKEDGIQLQDSFGQLKAEADAARQATEDATHESLRLKEILHDKENELARINQENKDLHAREAAALEKIEELTKLLEERTSIRAKEDDQLVNKEKSLEVTRKAEVVDEAPCENINEKSILVVTPDNIEKQDEDKVSVNVDLVELKPESENGNGKGNENGKDEGDSLDVEVSTWENCKISDKEASPKSNGQGAVDEDFDSKMDCDDLIQTNGLATESAENGANMLQTQQHKKKKALLHKFGGLLRKKNSHK